LLKLEINRNSFPTPNEAGQIYYIVSVFFQEAISGAMKEMAKNGEILG
jgi:hypothetical protein